MGRAQFCWVLGLLVLPASQALLEMFRSRDGKVSWVQSEALLEELKGVNATEDLHVIFRFDASEGNWAELQTLALEYPTGRTAVLMTDSRRLPRGEISASAKGALPYWVSSVYINMLYAMRHQYDFLRVELPEQGLIRHTSWYKLQVIRVLLSRYDWLMYLDSDAFFLSQERTLESLVEEFGLQGPKHLLLPENGLCCEKANTGVMLWRSSPEAQSILEDWWLCPRHHPESLATKAPGRREQGCFQRGGVHNKHRAVIALSNSTYLTTPEGTVVRHYWSTLTAEQRNSILQDAAAKIFMNEFRNWVMSDTREDGGLKF